MNFQSLSVKTLWKMSLRISLVISVVTIAGYFHLKMTIESQIKNTLASYTTEREARERIIFEEAQQNHQILKDQFLQVYRNYLKDPALSEKYQNLVKLNPDGAFRNRDVNFDGKTDSGIFIKSASPHDDNFMAKIIAAYEVSKTMGAAYHARFQDTYFTFPQNAIVLYWPEEPQWVTNAKPTLNLMEEEYASVSMPALNPERKTSWTGLFYDKVSKIWMITGSTPIYDGNEFLGSVHHDVMVTELIERTLNDHLKGTRNYVVRTDGRLIVHPTYLKDIQKHDGKYDISASKDDILLSQFAMLKSHKSDEIISDDHDNYLAIAKIAGPEWYLISEYPKSIVRKAALENVGFLLGAGFFSLVVELFILFFVLRREVSSPLLSLILDTKQVAQGNYSLNLAPLSIRKDELGMLAQSFNDMTRAIQERDRMLARHNEDLEALIEERTLELDRQKAINIHSSKLSALGEMAGGIAHEVNTPLATVKLLTSQAKKGVTDDIPDLEAIESSLTQIDRTVDRVAKIIRGLKSFSRNGSDDPFESSDLQIIIEDTISLCSERCKLHGIDLKVITPPTPVYISCRAVQLCQVLLNLINNAHDAVENASEKWIEVKLEEKDMNIQLSVTDSGPGISPELKEKIFNPFFTTKPVGKGTGMGLSISHGIVRSHNGSLEINEREKHTSFIISLPREPQSTAA